MNIFLLHENPTICAEQHCDKHVVKMVIEYAQLMSTAHRVLDGDLYEDRTAAGRRIKRWRHPNSNMEATLYKASHINHPDGLWVRSSDANYNYLYNLWCRLCEEYTHRYGRVHLTEEKLKNLLRFAPTNINHVIQADVHGLPLAMPDDVKGNSVVNSYRRYYKKYKIDFAKYTNRDYPEWLLA
mgnify:FL=1|tara:strand:- start:501 stop:1049 length:549 start_codon:yes stop_codon:yes gene_type:complete